MYFASPTLLPSYKIINRCVQGLRQSPIDLVPADLLYDPSLEELFITPNKVQGKVFNTGHTATFKVLVYHNLITPDYLYLSKVDPGNHHLVNITGGPLSYHYQVLTNMMFKKQIFPNKRTTN